ncbi:MAG: helix-turn-helix domain-containing protein [Lachnospirales bacterium]
MVQKSCFLIQISISQDLDFNDPSYFIKAFKKVEGVTPTSYNIC